jgi:uncharacterized protein YndB with AHSA1/START domain
MPDSLHEIPIEADPNTVYQAWTTAKGLSSWWTKDSRGGGSGKPNVFVFDGGNVEFHFRVDGQVPGKAVRWTGIKAEKMPDEWVGTKIEVDIAPANRGSRLRFGHKGWKTTEGMYCVCNTTWGELMYRLRDYCEGKGRGPLFPG